MSMPDEFDRLGQAFAAAVPDFEKFVDLAERFATEVVDVADGTDRLTVTLAAAVPAIELLGKALVDMIENARRAMGGQVLPVAKRAGGGAGGPGGGGDETADREKEANQARRAAGRSSADFNRVMNVMQTTLQGVSAVANVAHLALYGFHEEITKIGGQIAGFVKLLSPAIVVEYERSLAALHAQFGQVFAPVLVGLSGVVRVMANALAGLNGRGRMFIAFMAGAVVGMGAAVTAGGIFLGVLGAIAAGAIAGSVAFTTMRLALDGATAGFSEIGALIGSVLAVAGTGVAVGAGAGAGGLASMMLANGTLEKLTESFKPFVEVLIGTFNAVGAKLVPKLTQVANDIMPSLSRVFEIAVQYIEPFADVLAEFATDLLPPMLSMFADLLEAGLPFVVLMAKMAQLFIMAGGALMQFSAIVSTLLGKLNPINAMYRAVAGKPATAPMGNAPSPITGASFTAVEDAFKRAQEQAVIGSKADKVDPMERSDVRNEWAKAIGTAVASAVANIVGGGGKSVAGDIGIAMTAAIARGSSRSPTG